MASEDSPQALAAFGPNRGMPPMPRAQYEGDGSLGQTPTWAAAGLGQPPAHAYREGSLGSTSMGSVVGTLLLLGVVSAGIWWYLQNEEDAPPAKPARAKASSAKLPKGRWFYAEGDKSTFLFKAPKNFPRDDDKQQSYAEKISPDGGMIWKVRAMTNAQLARDPDFYEDMPRVG